MSATINDEFSTICVSSSSPNAEPALSPVASGCCSTEVQSNVDQSEGLFWSHETTLQTFNDAHRPEIDQSMRLDFSKLIKQLQVVRELSENCNKNGLSPFIQTLHQLNHGLSSLENEIENCIRAAQLGHTTHIVSTESTPPNIGTSSLADSTESNANVHVPNTAAEASTAGASVQKSKQEEADAANQAFDKLYLVKGTYVMQGLSPADCFYSWYDNELYNCTGPMSKEKRKCFGIIHVMVSYMKLFLPDKTIINRKPHSETSSTSASTSSMLTPWQSSIRDLGRSAEVKMMDLCNKHRGFDAEGDSNQQPGKRKRVGVLVSTVSKVLREIPFSAFPHPVNVVDHCISNFPSLSSIEEFHHKR